MTEETLSRTAGPVDPSRTGLLQDRPLDHAPVRESLEATGHSVRRLSLDAGGTTP